MKSLGEQEGRQERAHPIKRRLGGCGGWGLELDRELRRCLGLGRCLVGAQRRVRVQGAASGAIPFLLAAAPKSLAQRPVSAPRQHSTGGNAQDGSPGF